MSLPEVARLERPPLLHAFGSQGLPRPLCSQRKARQALPGLQRDGGICPTPSAADALRAPWAGAEDFLVRGLPVKPLSSLPRAAQAPG